MRPEVSDAVLGTAADVPPSVRDMINRCWDTDRTVRPSATECYAILSQAYNQLTNKEYDIFFSHPWVEKPLLRHVFVILTNLGYRVWYDVNDMGYDLVVSMRNGIAHSSMFIACVNEKYEGSKNCMFELEDVRGQHPSKPVVALMLQNPWGSGPNTWKASQKLGDLLQLSTKMYCDLSGLAANQAWQDEQTEPSPEMLDELRAKVDPLLKILTGINCKKSLLA